MEFAVIIFTTTNKMKVFTTTIGILLAASTLASTNSKISKDQYAETWSSAAVEQMAQFNIPASITLAQAILESASGNSELAVKGKNHFGIKCHGWKGKEMYLDDDKKNECFRVYKSAEESYLDHSEFLTKYNRYAFLFEYDADDYKSWAKGLKKAGYATNPKYPQLLIDLIEDMGLDKYDAYSKPEIRRKSKIIKDKKVSNDNEEMDEVEIPTSAVTQASNVHEVKIHSKGVKYVVAEKGDTFYKISSEFGLKLSQLYRYNSFNTGKDDLKEGDVIYIQPKRRRKIFKKEVITLSKAMSLVDVSQGNATNIKSLKRLNKISDGNETFAEGERVTLR